MLLLSSLERGGGSGFRGTPIKLLWDPDVGGVSL